MRRATITIGDEIEAQLDSRMRQQEATPSLKNVVQAALKEFIALRGFGGVPRRLHVTPSEKGSGSPDGSIAHDRYLAGK